MNREIYKDKYYTHLDVKKYHKDYEKKVENINWVGRHGFYPFIHFKMDFSKYTENSEGIKYIKPKERDIYYAAHIDRYIYEYYGNKLNNRYNDYMKKMERIMFLPRIEIVHLENAILILLKKYLSLL